MQMSLILLAVGLSLPGMNAFYTPVERKMFFDNLFQKTIHNGSVTRKSMMFEGNLYFWDTSNHTKHFKYCEHHISDSRFSSVHLNGTQVSSIYLQCVDSLECCELKCCEKPSLATILVRWTLLAITFVAIFVSCFECLRFSTVRILSKLRRDDECHLMISTVDGGYLNPQLDSQADKSSEDKTAEKRRLLMSRKYESMQEAVEKRNILSEAAVPLCSPITEESLPPLPSPNWHLRQMTRV